MLHPVALFPDLLNYPLMAYLVLRLVVVWGVIRIAWMRWKKPYKWLAAAEKIAALLILVGWYTQGALIAAIVFIIVDCIVDKKTGVKENPQEKTIRWIIIIIAFALLFLGPGAFALDYPL